MLPYTDELDATIVCRPPWRRAASSTIKVPVALAWWRGERVGDAAGHAAERGEVDDGVGTGEGGIEGFVVEDRAFDEAQVVGVDESVDVGAVAGGEVVDHRHLAPVRQQCPAQVAPDEPRSACDHDSHVRGG